MLLEKAQISSIEVITGTNELYALRDEWSQLWNRCPRATPFQSPEWILPWWRCFGNDRLHTLLLRREGRLVAMLPGYILEDCFQLLGIGSSDHLDLIAHPGLESDATGAMLDHLTGDQATWTRCEFQQLAPDSPLLQHSAASGWREEATVQDFCPVLNLPDRVEDLRNCIPGNRLRKMEHYRRQAEKAGAVRFEKAREKNLGELVDALIDLHARRWDERGQASILAADAAGAFVRQASAGSLAAGTLDSTLSGFTNRSWRFSTVWRTGADSTTTCPDSILPLHSSAWGIYS